MDSLVCFDPSHARPFRAHVTEARQEPQWASHGILVIGLCDLRSPKLGCVGLNETRAALGLLGLGIERELG